MQPDMSDTTLDTLLQQAEIDAERLVAVLRMLVSVGLGSFLFLAITPRIPEAAEQVLARQWTFAFGTVCCYFLLGLLTWLAVRRGLFRRWMVWPTAAADAIFVVVSVWLSMRNAGVPGDATFVFPSIWLVPVVLGFAILRFNPRVMALVVALLVGGIALLVVTGAGQGGDLALVRVWRFLSPPPNAMRLGMIAMAGILLIVAAQRARTLLARSIDGALRSANLTRYLPAQLAPRLAAGGLDELRRGQHGSMGVLFIDMRGFTTWSQSRAPEEITALMTDYRTRIAKVADDTGGLIDKFMGDAAMILFETGEDPGKAARACIDCATGLAEALRGWNRERVQSGDVPVAVGIGAHWGEVFSGVVGGQDRLEYSVFGDTVNTAARLEQMTKTEGMEIILSDDLLNAAGRGREGWTALGGVEVRGRVGTVDLWGRPPGPP